MTERRHNLCIVFYFSYSFCKWVVLTCIHALKEKHAKTCMVRPVASPLVLILHIFKEIQKTHYVSGKGPMKKRVQEIFWKFIVLFGKFNFVLDLFIIMFGQDNNINQEEKHFQTKEQNKQNTSTIYMVLMNIHEDHMVCWEIVDIIEYLTISVIISENKILLYILGLAKDGRLISRFCILKTYSCS